MAWRRPRGEVTEDEDDEDGDACEVLQGVLDEDRAVDTVIVIESTSSGTPSSSEGSASGSRGLGRTRAHCRPRPPCLRRRSISDPGRLASVLAPSPGFGPAFDGNLGPGGPADPGPGQSTGALLPGPRAYRLTHSVDKIVDFLKFLN